MHRSHWSTEWLIVGPPPMNAAGWHVCLDVLEPVLGGEDVPRRVGQDALAGGWEALRDKYADALS